MLAQATPPAAQRALLHLEAMGIPVEAEREPDAGRGAACWTLSVEAEQADAALAVLAEANRPEETSWPPRARTRPVLLPLESIWGWRNASSCMLLAAACIAAFWMLPAAPIARSAMIDAGAVAPWLVRDGQWWRLLTAAFLHFDLPHLLGNLSALFLLGPPLAARTGQARLLVLFVATALLGNVASQWLGDPVAVKAGASGGICGLMGALAGVAIAAMADADDAESRRPAWQTLGAVVALFGMIVGFEPGRDHYAHVGGLLSGVLLGNLLGPHKDGGAAPRGKHNHNTLRRASAIALPLMLQVLLARSGTAAAEDRAFARNNPAAPSVAGNAGQAVVSTATSRAAEQPPGAPGQPVAVTATSRPGEPPPGTVVQASNLEAWGRFLPPSIQWAVRRGLRIHVIEARDIPLEPARLAATAKYHDQCRLSDDGNQVLNYVAGLPFPLADERDPRAAVKLVFNYENRIAVDDLDVRNFECDTGSIGADTGLNVERHFLMGHFRRLYHVGRLYHAPLPTWPTPDGIRYREVLHPILEPFDLKGVGLTYNRHVDPTRQDDSWLYYPLLKRVRRLSSAQRSDALFGQDADVDSYGGYAGNPAWMEWRLLGTRRVLAPMHTGHFPAQWSAGAADFLFDDTWEMRDVYVLEGTSRVPGYAYSKRVLYLDRHSFVIPYTEMHDPKGALWKAWVNQWKIGRSPFPGAKKAVYDYEQQFIPALSIFDLQLGHATRCLLPSPSVPGEEGWYFNFGSAEGTTEEAFSVSTILSEGR